MFCISLWLQSYYIFARNERFAPIIFNLVPFRAYIIILVAWDSMAVCWCDLHLCNMMFLGIANLACF